MLTSRGIFLAPSFCAIVLTLGWCWLFASLEVVDSFSTLSPQSGGAASFLKARGHFVKTLSSSSPNTVGGARKKYSHQRAVAPTKEGATNGETPVPAKRVVVKRSKFRPFYKLPSKAYHIYTDYATRLWTETNTDARKKIANDKVKGAIRNMCHVVKSDEYIEFADGSIEARDRLLKACDNMLETLPKDPTLATSKEVVTTSIPKNENSSETPVKKKKANGQRSVLFGAVMGGAVACWVFSGNYVFTGLFALMTILGQLEYYRMVMNTGVYPARRISVIGAVSCFLTALFAPELHQICLPMFGLWAMIWFLTMRRQVASISEIAATFTGMFYLGYVPSFWVRTRLIGIAREPTRLANIVAPLLNTISRTFGDTIGNRFGESVKDTIFYLPITTGAIFIFWTWLCLAFNDVGAYFVGRKYGTIKLGAIAPAAGATSPNKSLQGVIGGCTASAALGILGAWVQKWPYFVWTGALHGVILGFLGLIGDLTASMLKRDAGLKDFGDLIPEHGGIMDRVDGFIWTAPYSWLVCSYVVPAMRAFSLR